MDKYNIALKKKEILEKAEKLKTKGKKIRNERIFQCKRKILRRWKKAYGELGLIGLSHKVQNQID